MKINGKQLPYVEIAADFSRSPARFSYEPKPKPTGGNRVVGKRLESEEIPIPIVIDRREDEAKSWDDIIEILTGMLYVDGPVEISFPYRKNELYYIGDVMALEITEEYEYVSKGNIVIFCEEQVLYGEEHTISVGTTSNKFNIGGQMGVPWTSETTFSADASQFKLYGPDGQTLILNYGFKSGDLLRIDFMNRRIRINGSTVPTAVDVRSEWFRIPFGSISLRASHKTDITYRERFY